jgi:hypothetical protein
MDVFLLPSGMDGYARMGLRFSLQDFCLTTHTWSKIQSVTYQHLCEEEKNCICGIACVGFVATDEKNVKCKNAKFLLFSIIEEKLIALIIAKGNSN